MANANPMPISLDAFTIAKVVGIVAVGVVLCYLARKNLMRILIKMLPIHIAKAIVRGVIYALVTIVALVAIGTLGVNLMGLAIAGGIVGIILGLGLQPIVSNLFAGLLIFSEKIVTPGSLVEIDGTTGTVVDVSLLTTKIQTLDGIVVVMPNNRVFNSVVKNMSSSPVRRLEFIVSIAYKEDAEEAYKVIRRVVEEHPFVLEEPAPEIFVCRLGSSGVDIAVRVWVPSQLWYDVQMDLLWKIKKSISEAGIEIPFNQVDIWFRTPLRVVKEVAEK